MYQMFVPAARRFRASVRMSQRQAAGHGDAASVASSHRQQRETERGFKPQKLLFGGFEMKLFVKMKHVGTQRTHTRTHTRTDRQTNKHHKHHNTRAGRKPTAVHLHQFSDGSWDAGRNREPHNATKTTRHTRHATHDTRHTTRAHVVMYSSSHLTDMLRCLILHIQILHSTL